MSVRLEWEGKPTQVERLSLPFQTVETINESRASRERDEGSLFGGGAADTSWRNQLIWGDNKLVMSSLLKEFAGQQIVIGAFQKAIRALAISEREATITESAFRVSETPAFPWSRMTVDTAKTVFNLTPVDNSLSVASPSSSSAPRTSQRSRN